MTNFSTARLTVILIFAVLNVLLFSSCTDSSSPTPNFVTLEGKVMDNDGNPISDVLISALQDGEEISQDISNDEGYYKLENIPDNDDSIIIKASHSDFILFESPITQFKTKTKDIILEQEEDECCSVANITIDNPDGDPLEDVQVKLTKGDEVIHNGTTDDEGKIIFEGLCPGKYWLRISYEGYKVIEDHFTVEDCDTLNIEYTLQVKESDEECCDNIIKFTIKDENADYLNGVEIKLRQGDKLIEVLYTESGQVIFDGICKGKYNVRIYKDGYNVMEFNVEVNDCNSTIEFTKTLTLKEDECCSGIITFWVKKADSDELISGAKVTLWKDGKKVETLVTENGKVIFDGLCKGKYAVDIVAEGYKSIEFYVQLDCNAEIEVNKSLTAKDTEECCDSKIKFTIKDENANYLNGVEIKLRQGDKLIEVLYTENGQVIFEDICKGKYNVRIYKDGYNVMEFNVEVSDCNSTLEFTKTLTAKEDECCSGIITFWVKKADSDELISGAKVTLWKDGKKVETLVTENGKVVFDGLCKGKYAVDIVAEGYKSIEFYVQLDCNAEIEVNKSLVLKQ